MTTTTATDEDAMVHHADCADWTAHADYDDCELDSWSDTTAEGGSSYTLTANPSQDCGPMGTFQLGMVATDAEDLDAVLDALAELTGRALELKRRMAA